MTEPVSFDVERVHRALRDGLRAVHEACAELGVEYWLDAGSALGAFRDGRIIAWDDDIDLCMRRADRERFVREAPALLGPRYSVQTSAEDPAIGVDVKIFINGTHVRESTSSALGISPTKHDGLYLDVLIADPLAQDARTRRVERGLAWIVRTAGWRRAMVKAPGLSVTARARWAVAAALPDRAVHHLGQRLDRRFRARETHLVGIGPAALFNGFPYPAEVVYPLQRIPFEGIDAWAPADLPRYLQGMYGDSYVDLPPEDARRPHADRVWFDETG